MGGVPRGETLKRVPQDLVAARALIDGEIALEHRAFWPERGNAGLNIGAPRLFQILRGRRLRVVKEIEADHLHAEAAEFDVRIGKTRDLLDQAAPLLECLVALARVRPDRNRAADVSGPHAATPQLNDQQASGDLAERHRDQGERPGGRADLVRDAEAADRRLGAVSDREGEDNPRSDPRDQQSAGEQADAGQRNAVTAEADVCRKPGDEAERQPDGCQQPDEQEVVPRGRNRVHVQVRHEEHHSQRNEETADIQSPLARLAKNDEDEC